ncbi:hypothetical protein N8720_04390 [Candidatus Marinimicrobia bacterium]|nr:hypothetical protein [Candidatus Neomarinimicrobiota bacterium]
MKNTNHLLAFISSGVALTCLPEPITPMAPIIKKNATRNSQ